MMSIGVAAGMIYALLSDGPTAWMPLTNGIIGGALLGLYTALLELQVFTARLRRKIKFIPLMLFRVFICSLYSP